MGVNTNYMGMTPDKKLVREVTRIIKEEEEKEKNRQSRESDIGQYKVMSRDGDILEISGYRYAGRES